MSKPLIVAHRGANEFLPEHSMAAFRQSVKEGADGWEFDIRLSADRQLVLHHDRTVNRTSNGRGSVSDLTVGELRRLDFSVTRSSTHPLYDNYSREELSQIVTFEEILSEANSVDHKLRLFIELKHPSRFGAQLEDRMLSALRDFPDLDACVMSFSKAAIRRVYSRRPDLPLVWIFEFPYGKPPLGVQALSTRVDYIDADRDFAERTRITGYDLFAWTVNDEESANRMMSSGASVLFTDRPGVLKETLGLDLYIG